MSIEDVEMKMRLATFIVGSTDPFATDIRYDAACWRKHITNVKNGGNIPHLNLQALDVNQLTFSQVKKVIFEENEQKKLKGPLEDYNHQLHL